MLNILVAFAVSVIMGMGIGGGGFLVIYLILCLKYPQALAQGTNLAFFIVASIGAVVIHVIKRKISFSQVLKMVLFGIVGTVIGSLLANRVNPEIARQALGWLLTVSGAISIMKIIIPKLKKKNK